MTKQQLKGFFIALLSIFILAACGTDTSNDEVTESDNSDGVTESESSDDVLQVVNSFTILDDIVNEIGGEFVETHNLVPIGTDPHEYEPLPDDIKAATDADILFYNGVNLEGGDHGWFAKMIDSVNQDADNIFEAAEGVEPMYLTSEDGKEEEINPHAFLDPVVGIKMVENIRDALIEIDPDHEEDYDKNAEEYLAELEEMDKQYQDRINDIPEDKRIFVTSERAYQYMAERYGLKEGYIWAVDTEENGSPEQITSLLDFLEENDPPVLFVETNVDRRPMETVSSESGIPIFDKAILSDEIGEPGKEGDTYIKFLQYNIDIIHEGLTSE